MLVHSYDKAECPVCAGRRGWYERNRGELHQSPHKGALSESPVRWVECTMCEGEGWLYEIKNPKIIPFPSKGRAPSMDNSTSIVHLQRELKRAQDALELVLLYYSRLNADVMQRWEEITGKRDASFDAMMRCIEGVLHKERLPPSYETTLVEASRRGGGIGPASE